MPNFIDLSGKRFGRLIVQGVSHRKYSLIYWTCLCDCGKTKVVRGADLRSGKIRSCGCLHAESARGNGRMNIGLGSIAIDRDFLRQYKRGAHNRHVAWDLSDEYAISLFHQPCHYCNQMGLKVFNYRHMQVEMNGIDRVDNNFGYVMGNVVPCCPACNSAKKTMSKSEFLSWVKKVYEANFV